jgi:hypothetical protein
MSFLPEQLPSPAHPLMLEIQQSNPQFYQFAFKYFKTAPPEVEQSKVWISQ